MNKEHRPSRRKIDISAPGTAAEQHGRIFRQVQARLGTARDAGVTFPCVTADQRMSSRWMVIGGERT
jgi:hypothetical protein